MIGWSVWGKFKFHCSNCKHTWEEKDWPAKWFSINKRILPVECPFCGNAEAPQEHKS